MAKEARCDLTNTGTSPGNWSHITITGGPFDLLDFSDGTDILWDWTWDNEFQGAEGNGVNAAGSGDAAWVDAAVVSVRDFFENDELTKVSISGLDNAKTYLITVFGSHNTNQACQSWINGDTANKLNHQPNGNSTLVNAHFAYSPSAGVITIEFGLAAASNVIVNAIRIEEQDAVGGRIMSSLAKHGGLVGHGGIAGQGGGLAG